ncbi:MAG: hypothetical protein D6831_03520 [Aquificota bacterium]|nr:MAG: hypothetical protein D6831_03520 [Aquificota bacterium]
MIKKTALFTVIFSSVFSFSMAFTKSECENYVKKVEACINKEKSGDLNTKWRKCETRVVTKLIQEQENQGNCFSFEECKDLVIDEMKSCKKQRTELYNELLKSKNN